MLLYCEYGLRIGDNASVFMLTACCWRMSKLLLLDVKQARDHHVREADAAEQAHMDDEINVRLFWSCYVLDPFVGSGVDSNLCWPRPLSDVLFPSDDHEFSCRTPGPAVTSSDEFSVSCGLRAQFCRIVGLRTQALRHENHPHPI